MKTPDQTTRERVRELRKRHGWTQQDLADVLNRIGARPTASPSPRSNSGSAASLYEALQYALALDVAPVHLIVPVDNDERSMLGANFVDCTPTELRAWIRGQRPLLPQDPRIYFADIPREEWVEPESEGAS